MSELFERRERRYLIRDARTLRRHLDRHAQPVVYRVSTLYLDHPKPTWSAKRPRSGTVKLRLRQYGSEAPWYLERKTSTRGQVSKTRERVDQLPIRLRLITTVHYRRTAWELPDGVRVTLDEQITSPRGVLAGKVIEVKAPGAMPDWLARRLPKPAGSFSKSAWALGRWTR